MPRPSPWMALLFAAVVGSCDSSPSETEEIHQAASLTLLRGNDQTANPGQAFPSAVVVRVTDQDGKEVPNRSVAWDILKGGGSWAQQTTKTDASGLARNSWTAGAAPGEQRGSARIDHLLVEIWGFAGLPPEWRVTVTGGGAQRDTVTRVLSEPLVIRVRRIDGSHDVGAEVKWAVSDKEGGKVEPAVSIVDSAGYARARWTLGTKAGQFTATASVRDLPPVKFEADAYAGPAARIAIPSTLPMIGLVGTQLHPTASAQDAHGNRVGDVSWASREPGVATVSQHSVTGEVTVQAEGPGSTDLVVTSGDLADSVRLHVMSFDRITEGGGRVCGITGSGALYCWAVAGNGYSLQDAAPPQQVSPDISFASASMDQHTCALSSDSVVYCWGANFTGQTGTGSTAAEISSPQRVASDAAYRSVSVGRFHSCAATTVGEAHCWGSNWNGQLGLDTLTSSCGDDAGTRCSSVPLRVAGDIRFSSVSAGGEHSCGISEDEAAYCWGLNGAGQLGTADVSYTCPLAEDELPCSRVPVPVEGEHRFTQISGGGLHTCALTREGTAYCWGDGRAAGNGDAVPVTSPTLVAGGYRFSTLVAGMWHTCALTPEGDLYCWGGNLGPFPVHREAGTTFTALAGKGDSGGMRVCATAPGRGLRCWY